MPIRSISQAFASILSAIRLGAVGLFSRRCEPPDSAGNFKHVENFFTNSDFCINSHVYGNKFALIRFNFFAFAGLRIGAVQFAKIGAKTRIDAKLSEVQRMVTISCEVLRIIL